MTAHPFYGKNIDPDAEQKKIEKLLAPFRDEVADEELKKRIYETLSAAKAAGEISIPFKIFLRKGEAPVHRDFVEVVLDTKV